LARSLALTANVLSPLISNIEASLNGLLVP
jgi:hypothetical protein